MLKQIVIVGRVVNDLEVNRTEEGKRVGTITLAVPRNFKNSEGVYDTDFINCIVWDNMADNTADYCKKGDIIGVKGRIQSRDNKLELVAEKVTFLSSRNHETNSRKEQDREDR